MAKTAAACAVVTALCSLAVALPSLLNPEGVAQWLGLSFSDAFGLSEFRSLYGGLYTGLTVLFLAAALWPTLQAGAFAFFTLGSAGVMVVRLITAPLDDMRTQLLVAGEVLFILIGLLGLRLAIKAAKRNLA